MNRSNVTISKRTQPERRIGLSRVPELWWFLMLLQFGGLNSLSRPLPALRRSNFLAGKLKEPPASSISWRQIEFCLLTFSLLRTLLFNSLPMPTEVYLTRTHGATCMYYDYSYTITPFLMLPRNRYKKVLPEVSLLNVHGMFQMFSFSNIVPRKA